MPFTLSHPAAVAPLWPLVRRNLLPLSALVIGTLSPDFEYLWHLGTGPKCSHTAPGVLYFCLPAGILALGLWVGVVRDPIRRLLAISPSRLSASARWWLLSGVAIIVGAATHLTWDGFTHASGWATRIVPVLRARILVAGIGIPVFNILQHVSTAIGGLVVVGWLVHEVRAGEPRALLKPWRISVFASFGAVAAAFAGWNGLRGGAGTDYWGIQIAVRRGLVGGLLGLGLAVVGYGVIYRLLSPGPSVPGRLTRG